MQQTRSHGDPPFSSFRIRSAFASVSVNGVGARTVGGLGTAAAMAAAMAAAAATCGLCSCHCVLCSCHLLLVQLLVQLAFQSATGWWCQQACFVCSSCLWSRVRLVGSSRFRTSTLALPNQCYCVPVLKFDLELLKFISRSADVHRGIEAVTCVVPLRNASANAPCQPTT
jgi:hypothetical protein